MLNVVWYMLDTDVRHNSFENGASLLHFISFISLFIALIWPDIIKLQPQTSIGRDTISSQTQTNQRSITLRYLDAYICPYKNNDTDLALDTCRVCFNYCCIRFVILDDLDFYYKECVKMLTEDIVLKTLCNWWPCHI